MMLNLINFLEFQNEPKIHVKLQNEYLDFSDSFSRHKSVTQLRITNTRIFLCKYLASRYFIKSK